MKKSLQFLFALVLAGMAGQGYAQSGPNITNLPPVWTNSGPFVNIEGPGNGAKFLPGANVRICAAAAEPGGTITKVEIFSGANSLGLVTPPPAPVSTNPFPQAEFFGCLTWSNVASGSYTLTAVATDGGGVMATSAPVNFTVLSNTPPPPPPPASLPVVAIVNPTNGASFYSNATVDVCAAAFETNGLISTVQYFAGNTSLGVVSNGFYATPEGTPTGSPAFIGRFCLSWPNVAPGDYTLTAVATDIGGVTATSAPVSITVAGTAPTPPPPPTNLPPKVQMVTPDNGQRFFADANILLGAAAQDPNGYVVSVEFFAGGTSLGVVSSPVPPVDSPMWHQGFLTLTWSNVPPGNYALTAVATDNGGLTGTSAPVNITVVTNTPPPPPPPAPPVVAIVNPVNGAKFFADANIRIDALAHDTNGIVTSVEFFAGTNSLGVVTNKPIAVVLDLRDARPDCNLFPTFSLIWSNAAAGDYALTAVATDSAGLNATSAPVSITVLTNLPPPPPTPTNRPPKVEIVNPEDGDVFFANQDIDVCAAAADADGYVAAVEFFASGTSLGVVTNAPPSAVPHGWFAPRARLNCITWPSVAPGDYTLTAVATDNGGLSTTSAPVNITVSTNLPPAVPSGN